MNNNEKTNRTSSSKKNSSPIQTVLDIWNVLAEHATAENPLTISQIAKILDQDREKQLALSGSTVNRRQYAYTEKEAREISAENSTTESLPTSGKTVQRNMPQSIDTINALTPHTVICEDGTPTVIHSYSVQDTLHIVIEDPHGIAQYEGDATVILKPSPITPIPKKTLDERLPTLMEQFEAASCLFEKWPPMLSLSAVVLKNGKYIPALDHEALEEGKEESDRTVTAESFKRSGRSPTRRYYLKSILTSAEWRIFHDLICVYPYIDERQTKKFLSVLRRIAPDTQKWPDDRYAPKTNASLQFSHIETLDQAIAECRKISLTYGIYLLEQHEKKTPPRPVLRQRIDFRKKGKRLPFVYIVEPYALMWSNGYYYLVGKTDKGMRNFRMDRILTVQHLQEHFQRDSNFDPYEYRDQSPIMHPGKPVYIRMRCPISLLSAVIDTFGSSVKEYSSRYTLQNSDSKASYTDISLWSSEEGARLFAMEYADKVEILEPQSLRDTVASSLRAALEKYQ